MAASRRITAGDGTDTVARIRIPAALLVALLLAPACGGGGAPAAEEGPEVPPVLAAFLQTVEPHATVPFSATYEVLQKIGGETVTVKVDVDPPSWRIEVVGEDVVVTDTETCVRGTCRDGVQENELTAFGFNSRFYSESPAKQLETDAGREGARTPDLSVRELAGVAMECAAVPVGAAAPTTACLTPDGVFGFVDDPARRVELREYRPG